MDPLLLLAEQHRTAQDRLAASLAKLVLAGWRRDIHKPSSDSIIEGWIASLIPLVLAYRERSEGTAQIFYERSRITALPDVPFFTAASADPIAEDAIATSLLVTGPIGLIEKLNANMSLADALAEAGDAAAGAAIRHTLNGGRSSVLNSVKADPVALGYYRKTAERPCSFCAMLASRGAIGKDGKRLPSIYSEDSFAASDALFTGDGTAKVHDKCHCTLEPIMFRTQALPDRNQAFADLWVASTNGLSGNDALNAFRRVYEAANAL